VTSGGHLGNNWKTTSGVANNLACKVPRVQVGDKQEAHGNTVVDKVPRFPEPCTYMPEEGDFAIPPPALEIET